MSEFTKNDLQEIIEREANEIMRLKNLDDISQVNNGHCQLFVRSVFDTVRRQYGVGYVTLSPESNASRLIENTYGEYSMVDGAHAWIEFKGKHFDAECPEGTEEASELPIFQRAEVQNPAGSEF